MIANKILVVIRRSCLDKKARTPFFTDTFLTINLVLKIKSELSTSSLVQSSSIEPKYLVS